MAKETWRRAGTRGASRVRDEILKWEGEGYGIKHQPWSNKPVDRINTLDLEDYWSVLDKRRTPTNNMSGTKKQQKTLIKKLLTEARQDFPHLGLPDFPEISSQKHQVRHLTRKEWDRLLKKVVELSEGAARKDLSVPEYQDLQFSKANNQNQRNWVDLYDCLNLMWFFYLRAEDLPRIKAEWFQDRGEEIVCVLEITKEDRNKQETTHYSSDAVENWRWMNQRRPKGFLVFPHTKRSAGEINEIRTYGQCLRILSWNYEQKKTLRKVEDAIYYSLNYNRRNHCNVNMVQHTHNKLIRIHNHKARARRKNAHAGFSIIELVVVVAVLATLTGIALPNYFSFVRDSYQTAATVEVEHLLKTLAIHRAYNGRFPSSWSGIEKYLTLTQQESYESCTDYGSECNDNERVIVSGQYLVSFYTSRDEARVSAWRFNNDGDSSTNRSVFGCIKPGGKSLIYAWKKEGSYWQGPAWEGGMEDDNGNPINGCQ